MRRFNELFVALTLFSVVAAAQGTSNAPEDEPLRVGPGILPPKLLKKEEPRYTPQALRARVQGEVLLSIIVEKSGLARNVYVLSPLGFSLDEAAINAVSNWRFRPAMKDGKPVSVQATVDVTFRLGGEYFDAKAERNRTRFNAIASRLNKDGKPTDADVREIRQWVSNKFPPAEYLLGLWEVHGTAVPQDVATGLARIQRAADKDYGPAMFFIGNAKYRGTLLPKDGEAGLKLIREAAVLGDVEAQYMLGQMYEYGIGVAIDRERAKRYYRLCAAKATAACEFRLGQLLLAVNGDQEPKRLEAIAWLELAEGHHIAGADKAASAARANLTEEQKRWVSKLKGQLEQRP